MRLQRLLTRLICLMMTLVFLSAAPGNVYGSHANVPVNGTISPFGCTTIGGKMITDAIDYIQPPRLLELCEFHDLHFKIIEYRLCAAGIMQWTDPDTGTTYTLGVCDVPNFNIADYCGSEAQVVTPSGRALYVLFDSTNSTCQKLVFSEEEKRISITVSISNFTNRMNVTIPTELLGGKFHLIVDKGGTEDFLMTQTANFATISFSKFISCPGYSCGYQMDIYGTEVIPEFGSTLALIIGAVSIAAVLTSNRYQKYNR